MLSLQPPAKIRLWVSSRLRKYSWSSPRILKRAAETREGAEWGGFWIRLAEGGPRNALGRGCERKGSGQRLDLSNRDWNRDILQQGLGWCGEVLGTQWEAAGGGADKFQASK